MCGVSRLQHDARVNSSVRLLSRHLMLLPNNSGCWSLDSGVFNKGTTCVRYFCFLFLFLYDDTMRNRCVHLKWLSEDGLGLLLLALQLGSYPGLLLSLIACFAHFRDVSFAARLLHLPPRPLHTHHKHLTPSSASFCCHPLPPKTVQLLLKIFFSTLLVAPGLHCDQCYFNVTIFNSFEFITFTLGGHVFNNLVFF